MTKGTYLNVTQDELNDLYAEFRKQLTLTSSDNRDHLFGQFLNYLQINKIIVMQPTVQKQCKATLVNWQRHTMTNNSERALQSYVFGLFDPQIKISGTYENTGYHTHTSALVSFHFNKEKQEGFVETANSIYKIKGPEGDPFSGNTDIGNLVNFVVYD